MKIIFLSIIIFLSALPVMAQTTPKKQFPIAKPDIFVSIARTAPINNWKWKASDWNGEVTFIFVINKPNGKPSPFAIQFEFIQPFSNQPPLFRAAFAVRICCN